MAVNRTVAITGAGSGLGRDLCLQLAQQGSRVIALDKNMEAARQTIAMLSNPSKGQAYEIDVTLEEQSDRFAQRMIE